MQTKTIVFRLATVAAVSLVIFASAFAAPLSKAAMSAKAEKVAASGSSAFVENAGQWDSRAQFLSRTNGLNLWITQGGPVFEFNRFVTTSSRDSLVRLKPREGYIKGHVVKMTFVNANPTAVTGQAKQEGTYSYFQGKDSSQWVTGARSYGQVTSERPYDGISIRYSIDKGTPRYDVIVKPGADPSQVGIKLEGADDARILDNGNLELKTSLGTVEERGLTAFQETKIGRTEVPCKMSLEGNTVRFDTGSYDPAKTLIIDPLVASTYLGGSESQSLTSVALDSNNFIYVGGNTSSTDFPTTAGAFTSTGNILSTVSKLDPSESDLVYSATIGGSGASTGNAIAIDSAGDAYLAGGTSSTSFPVTTGAFQATQSPGQVSIGFVTEIGPSGTSLVYSTFLGGSVADGINGIAVDASGDAFLTGETFSPDFPFTAGAFQTTFEEPSGAPTCFVTELNPTGTALNFSTFLGGTNGPSDEGESAKAIALDSSNEPVVVGTTSASDFPTTAGAVESHNNEGTRAQSTCFVTKLKSTGAGLIFSSFFGGSGNASDLTGDVANAVAIDSAGNITFAGTTASADFPVTDFAFNSMPEINSHCGFITRLDSTGDLIYSTCFGGTFKGDQGLGLAVDQAGNAIVVGLTGNPDFPTTSGAFDTVNGGFTNDQNTGYVFDLTPDGETEIYGSYIGGTPATGGEDVCQAVKVSSQGNIVIAGSTASPDFPTTQSAVETTMPGTQSGFIITLNTHPFSGFTVSPDPIDSGGTATATVTLSNPVSSDTSITLSTLSSSISIPPTVTISSGKATTTFSVIASTVTSTTQAEIFATLGSATQDAFVEIVPSVLSSMVIKPIAVVGGNSAVGSVFLNTAPNQGNLTVQLQAADTSTTTVPATLTIPHGATSVSFSITTIGTNSGGGGAITATLGQESVSAVLTVNPAMPASLTVSPSSVTGGTTLNETVQLTGQAGQDGTQVTLSSSNSEAFVFTNVTVPQGATSAQSEVDTSPVSSQSVVTLSAKLNGVTVTCSLTLVPATISSLSLEQPLILAGKNSIGVVQLAAPAGPFGDTVKLSSNSSRAAVPSTVKVAAGASSATFTITTVAVSSDTVATITATFGHSSSTVQLFLLPAPLSSLTISPTSLVGGGNLTITVTLASIAGPTGNAVKLASNSSKVPLPATITVPAGLTSHSFSVTTTPTSSTSVVTITDTFSVYSQTTTVTVTPAPLTSLGISPNPVVGGQTTTGTVHIAGPAGPGGDVIKLASNNADATVLATVTVPANQTSTTFSIHTVAVTASKAVVIKAVYGTSTVSQNLTISP